MRLGLFGARADNGGLGCQTFEFFRNMRPVKTAIIDISSVNKQPNFMHRYMNAKTPDQEIVMIKGFPTVADCREFIKGIDVLICFEIPYNYEIFRLAREAGVKTVLQYNYEFLEYMKNNSLPLPDVFISPSQWHMTEVIDKLGKDALVLLIHNPVARDRLPWRKISQIKTFVHVAGVALFKDRNGTNLLLDAIPHIKRQNIKIIIYSQHKLPQITDPRVEVREMNIEEYPDLYKEGDCLILPRRYGGQTLQLNEAMSCGMIPIMLNIDPNGHMCRPESLVEVTDTEKITTRGATIDCANTKPEYLAAKIDEFANMRKEQVEELNLDSNGYAEWISWESLQPKWEAFFEDLCRTSQ